jgi:hypothetical protein
MKNIKEIYLDLMPRLRLGSGSTALYNVQDMEMVWLLL